MTLCRALPANHPLRVECFQNAGSTQLQLLNPAAAEQLYRDAAAVAAKVYPPDHPLAGDAVYNLGVALAAQGKADAARPFLADGNARGQRALHTAAQAQSERQQLTAAARQRRRLDHLLSLAGGGEAVYESVLLTKGAVTARRVGAAAGLDRADPDVAARLDELGAVSRRLVALAAAAAPDTADADETRKLAARRDALERELAERSPAYRRALAPVRTAAVAAALPDGAALVDFLLYLHRTPPARPGEEWQGGPRLVAFVVRRGADVVRVDLGDAMPVAVAVDRWRARYATDPPAKVEGDPGAALRRLVWEPVAKHLGGAKTVLVSPDGPLTAVPFAALPGDKADTFLIEDGYTFATVPVPQLLPEAAAPRPAGEPNAMLLVGDVDFGPDDLGPRYARLRGTRAEVATIAGQHERAFGKGGAVRLERADATRAAFVAAAPKQRFLHLATHGFFEGENVKSALDPTARAGRGGVFAVPPDALHPGLLSGVVFAGANADPAGGLLTALEAGDLDLKGVELAVLSACNTGRGKVAGGEGVVGLQRAFQVAGVRTTVATLWSVDDRDAEEVTTGFYEQLWEKKLPPAAALRAAQLEQLRAVRRRNVGAAAGPAASPYRWAGFVVAGSGR